jgi:hypothetical protein
MTKLLKKGAKFDWD